MVWKPDYATADELAEFRRIDDDLDDTQLGWAITTASRAVDNHTHRQFGKIEESTTWRYTPEWDNVLRRWVVDIDDVMVTPSQVEILTDELDDPGDGTVITKYVLLPRNNVDQGRPYERIVIAPGAEARPARDVEGCVAVTANPFGWDEVPAAVKEAALLQGSRLASRRQSPHGVAGSPTSSSEIRLLQRVDPDVAVSLSDYVRWWAAA